MKKRWIAGLLILALCLSLVACGGGSAEDPAVDLTTVDGVLTLHGYAAQDLLLNEQDSIDVDKDGDLILHSAASFEEVSKAVYDACGKAADDGIVRDYISEAPIEYAYKETMLFFGCYRNGEFEFVMVSPIWSDQETGTTDYLLQWS